MSRTVATYVSEYLLLGLFLVWFFYSESDRLVLLLGIVVLGAWIRNIYRYILTESFITRFQTLVIHGLEGESQYPEAMHHQVGTGQESLPQASSIEIKLHEQSDRSVQQQKKTGLRTDLIVTCPECGVRVLPKADGTCPSCQAEIYE